MIGRTMDLKKGPLLFLLVVAMCLFLRFFNLGSGYFWHDEVSILTTTFHSSEGPIETSLRNLEHTSSSWLPIFIIHILVRIFGYHSFILRLPAVIISLASLWILYSILTRLFSNSWARYLPLFFYTFSVPSIIYGQSLQLFVCYFFATTIQLLIFIKIVRQASDFPKRVPAARQIQLLTRVSFIAFLLSYMSLIIHLILVTYYIIFVTMGAKKPWKRLLPVVWEAMLDFIPLGILAYLRFRGGGYRTIYALGGIKKLLFLSYDFLTYHFNYAFTPNLYRPLAVNPTSLPFIILFAIGIIYFLSRHRRQRLPALIAILVFLGAAYAELVPFGGVRHSLPVAPFAFIFVGYGIKAFQQLTNRSRLSRALFHGAMVAMLLIMLLTFLISGHRLYAARESTLDLREVVRTAVKHNVREVIGFRETFYILTILDATEGNLLKEHGLDLRHYDPGLNNPFPERSLFIATRHAFNPGFDEAVKWKVSIPLTDFKDMEITPLRESIGPLEPAPGVMRHQSIYYPINGCFIYLLESRKE